MAEKQNRNPYEVLRMSTKASVKEIIDRCKELTSETMDKEKIMAYRRAAEEITQHPVRRARNQFWEPPDTHYDDDVIRDFCQRFGHLSVDMSLLEEHARRFVEEDCSPKALAHLALPPIEIPREPGSFPLEGIPQTALRLPLEPWELFL